MPAAWAGFSLSQEHPKSLLGSATAQGSWDPHHLERAASKAGEGPHATRTLAPVRALQGRGRKAGGDEGGCGRTAGRGARVCESGIAGKGQPRGAPAKQVPATALLFAETLGRESCSCSPMRHLCEEHKDPFSPSRCYVILPLLALVAQTRLRPRASGSLLVLGSVQTSGSQTTSSNFTARGRVQAAAAP